MLTAAFALAFVAAVAQQAPQATPDSPIRITRALALPRPKAAVAGRSLLRIDPVEYAIVTGAWRTPKEGDTFEVATAAAPTGQTAPAADPPLTWTRVTADEQGAFVTGADKALAAGLNGGSLFATVDMPADMPGNRIMMLEAAGSNSVFVNGQPRGGDPYSTGMVSLPVSLHAGTNELLFANGRGSLRAALVPPPAPAFILDRDILLPTIVAGRETTGPVGVVIVNASEAPLVGARVRIASDLPEAKQWVPLGTMPPLTVKKIALPARFNKEGSAASRTAGSKHASTIELVGAKGQSLFIRPVEFSVAAPTDRRVVTRRSTIDDSVQYYSLVPSTATRAGDPKPGILLSLHGASVEATSQANAYKPKKEAHIVCPTNRRPYGFDWEDWGRLDAAEALAHARAHLETDPRKVWLTGHSMGGHGTWQIGAQFPGEFAAIAPSAGWISFSSYTGGRAGAAADATPAGRMLARAALASDTLELQDNYRGEGVYVLHGDADDNVPVQQARQMFKQLAGIAHPDFSYYERPGAGHWWGDECVDWPPLMRFLFARALPEPKSVMHVAFRTAAPQVSQRRDWVRIEQQQRPFQISSVDVTLDPKAGSIDGTTTNVQMLTLVPPLDAPAPGQTRTVKVKLDGQSLEATQRVATPHLRFVNLPTGDGKFAWSVDPQSASGAKPAPIPPTQKKPARGGPFKMAFAHGFVAVVGTQGSPAADALLLAKARLDAENWWVRGNGRFELIMDTDFDAAQYPGRNIVLYGNRDENSAWSTLLRGDESVTVRNGSVTLPTGPQQGDDIALLAVRPRADDPAGQVGIVAATGAVGMRSMMRTPVFVSGVGVPDLVAWRASTLRDGATGILEAGYFGNDWSVANGSWMERAQDAPKATPNKPDK